MNHNIILLTRGVAVTSSLYILWLLVERANLYPDLAMMILGSSFLLLMHLWFLLFTWFTVAMDWKAGIFGAALCVFTALLI